MANHKGKQRVIGSPRTKVLGQIPVACQDETKAVEFFEEQRWGETPNCPRCGDTDVRQMLAKDGTRNARYLWKCAGCKQQYTVRVGTIMEDSPIRFRHWAYAFWAACASKKGVSALQIQRMTGVSYKSALFMMHRIRFAMHPTANEDGGSLKGIVEFDETYVGGKPRKPARHADGRPRRGPAPDFKDRKTPVVAGVERGGRVKARVATNVNGDTLRHYVSRMVDQSATVYTDERPSYKNIGQDFDGGHDTVNHSKGEYVRGEVYTNTIESFFAILKRGVVGTFHNVSKKHLHRYVAEFEFKYNTRKLDDGERLVLAIQQADNKRLTYQQQIDG
jgi:transposase-like protein